MGPFGDVEVDPLGDTPSGPETVRQLVQGDGLVCERAPRPLDKDIVHDPAAAIHGDADAGILERAGEGGTGELAALVGVENLRRGVPGRRRVRN